MTVGNCICSGFFFFELTYATFVHSFGRLGLFYWAGEDFTEGFEGGVKLFVCRVNFQIFDVDLSFIFYIFPLSRKRSLPFLFSLPPTSIYLFTSSKNICVIHGLKCLGGILMVLKGYKTERFLVGLVYFQDHWCYHAEFFEFLSERFFDFVDVLSFLEGDVFDVEVAFVLLIWSLGFMHERFYCNRTISKRLPIEVRLDLIRYFFCLILDIAISKWITILISL